MKVCMFHLMPYRDLPADFEQRYKSAYHRSGVVRRRRLGKGRPVLQRHARRAASCGQGRLPRTVHQSASPERLRLHGQSEPDGRGAGEAAPTARTSPSFSSARRCRRPRRRPASPRNMRCSIASAAGGWSPAFPPACRPTRRSPMRVVPVEQRERFREALALVTKAWSAKEIFAWNGKHYQLGMVNLWPRPIQQPHPPIWIPGSGISSTAEYVVGLDHCFCHLSYYGAKNATEVTDRYWELTASKGRDDNPLSAQLPAAHRRRRQRCRGGGYLRPARRIFLPQAALYAAVLSADSGLPRISGAAPGADPQSARRG